MNWYTRMLRDDESRLQKECKRYIEMRWKIISISNMFRTTREKCSHSDEKKKNSFLFTILMSATMKKKKDIIFSDKKRKKIFLSFVLILIFLYGGGKIHSNSWFFFHSWYSVFVQPICYNSNIFFNEKNKRYYLYYGEGKIFLILLLSSILISFIVSIIVKKEWYSWLCRFFHSSILRL